MILNKKLKDLAFLSKKNCPIGFKKVSDFQDGAFDHPDFLTPFTIGAHNINSKLMIVAQDWSSSKWLNNPENLKYASLGRDTTLATNKNLDEYLKFFNLKFSDVYATNAFIYIKEGNMNAGIKKSFFRDSFELFLLPQIKIINPKIIICLGSMVFNEFRYQAGLKPAPIKNGHKAPFKFLDAQIFGTFHTGGLGTANAGSKENAARQWKVIAERYNQI